MCACLRAAGVAPLLPVVPFCQDPYGNRGARTARASAACLIPRAMQGRFFGVCRRRLTGGRGAVGLRTKDSGGTRVKRRGVSCSAMKYMENERFGLFNQALSNVEIGDKVITGRIELYSCKWVVGGSIRVSRALRHRLECRVAHCRITRQSPVPTVRTHTCRQANLHRAEAEQGAGDVSER